MPAEAYHVLREPSVVKFSLGKLVDSAYLECLIRPGSGSCEDSV
jgi:hypothetical protein